MDINKAKLLTWIDGASIITGIILGTGIFYVMPYLVAKYNPSTLFILLTWVFGAFSAWCGALCYSELSGIFPENGGEYLYLKEAYKFKNKSFIGFLFAFAQIVVIRPASIITMSIVSALNLKTLLLPFFTNIKHEIFIILIPFIFTALSLYGVKLSKNVHNIVTVVKLFLLIVFISLGLYLGLDKEDSLKPIFFDLTFSNIFLIGMAVIPVMWVFGGWSEVTYIAGEIKDGKIPLALSVGIFIIAVLYLLTNLVYILHYSPHGMANEPNLAPKLMGKWFGEKGNFIMCGIIVISAMGAISGMIFTGGRFANEFFKDLNFLKVSKVSNFSQGFIFNYIIIIIMLFFLGFEEDGIEKLLFFTSGVIWIFYILIIITTFIFRKRGLKKKFVTPFYPLPQCIFLIISFIILWGSFNYKPFETTIGILTLFAGIVMFVLLYFKKNKENND